MELSIASMVVQLEKLDVEKTYELNRWLSTKKPSTRITYKRTWKLYKEFLEEELKRGFEDAELAKYLIDEIEKDEKLPARKRGEPSRRIIRWSQWLKARDMSNNSIKTRVGGIMAFYRENGYKMSFTRRFSDLFPAGGRAENKKMLLRPEDVKKLVDNAKCLRDKSMILTQYEGGMDTQTLCNMNVGDVLELTLKDAGIEFMTIHLFRAKEEWSYFTHIGHNAVKALRAYLKERQMKGYKLDDKSPLFVKSWTKKGRPRRIRERNVQHMVKETAIRAGLISPALLKPRQQSPVKPYSLRGSFSTLLENVNCPFQFKEFWQGHKIKYRGVYFVPTEEISLKTYMEHYNALSIEQAVSNTAMEKKLQDQAIQIQSLISRVNELERVVRIKEPIGAMGLRTAQTMKGVLLDAKNNPKSIDSNVEMCDEIIEDIHEQELEVKDRRH